ncbi:MULTISPECIES: M20/M25/M40 family metallo-hydrolase [Halolamina]|uniref:Acetylornithine deacetylase n=1 Tax=Halolamina pelagica TaxID=699431 RepID=A0A1I5NJJ5_9EURY|nr:MULTISPECIES: M20/M25/M40 family metallo-hydrolase [Halolamina]NHX36348.1 M20/M25/M40 family metallo-hydrolase [Halolamina sp. R1-12]SFP21954.1 acetylornithine deacetylase [Halolamina pelagica]
MSFDPIDFLADAVRADSTTDVRESRDLLLDALRDDEHDPDVDAAGNVRASRGSGRPHLVFNTHLDTVSPHVPFERDGEVIRGRGACDAKGPLAALLAAFLEVEIDEGTLTLAVTPDEEALSTGAHALMTGEVAPGGPGEAGASVDPLPAVRPEPDAFVVGEPTGLDVCTAARGRFEGTIAVEGTAAHAASPESGVNAVSAAGRLLGALAAFDGVDAHPQLGEATLVPTGIDGGKSTNQVPAGCEITVDRRSVPPETAAGFRRALETHLGTAVSADASVSVSLTERETPFLEAFATDPEEPVVGELADAAATASEAAGLGECGAVRPFGAATEASYFAPVPTVVFGPGHLADDEGAVAHAEREYVEIPAVRAAATAVRTATERLLGVDGSLSG